MSFAYDTNETHEYATRTEIYYMFRVSMAHIARAIDKGKLELHLIDGRSKYALLRLRSFSANERTLIFLLRAPYVK